MIHVEKLRLHGRRLERRSLLLLTDLLHKDNSTGLNWLGLRLYTHLLKPHVLQNLKGIKIGDIYGSNGISIHEIIELKPQIIIETNQQDLFSLSFEHQRYLLQNYILILSDFEEGGGQFGLVGPDLITHIKKLNVLPKQIYFVSSGFNQRDYLDLNIKHIYIPIWPLITIMYKDFYIDMVFDENKKLEARTKILNKNKKFGICLNRKPRPYRIKVLAELHNKKLLDEFDWSLVYVDKNVLGLGRTDNNVDFVKSPSIFRYNDIILKFSDQKILNFLNDFDFPRLMPDTVTEVTGDGLIKSLNWLGKYNYYISNETHVENIPTGTGTSGFITEKTFKSFCIGAYPLVISVPGTEKKVKELGFELIDYGYDDLSGDERISAVCDVVSKLHNNKESPNIDMLLHNFNLITDLNFLSNIISDTLNSIKTDLETTQFKKL